MGQRVLVWIGGAACAAVLFLGSAAAGSALFDGAPGEKPAEAAQRWEPDFERNEQGLTYGGITAGEDEYVDEDAYRDLMLVVSDEGRRGYVYAEEFFPRPPSTLEEAREMAANPRAAVLDVFESDGVTKIGTFTITTGERPGAPAAP
ncbi:hypothetical protein [Nocardioides daejeonensis]|uniref:hypothetical protein n=1 Tax=Nocardioides daejeonensis TaxID=1046556 RepID=UPI000D746D48|nr:hypothetical protein [Nocardioides daejeonensis]